MKSQLCPLQNTQNNLQQRAEGLGWHKSPHDIPRSPCGSCGGALGQAREGMSPEVPGSVAMLGASLCWQDPRLIP